MLNKEVKISCLWITEFIHFFTALVLFLLFSSLFGFSIGLLAFLGAFLIDGDHMFDYFVYILKTKKSFSLKRFFQANYFDETGKIFVLLHSWELAMALAASYFISFSTVFLVLGVSILVHLIVDQFTNHVNLLAYFLTWRAINKFDVRAVCDKS